MVVGCGWLVVGGGGVAGWLWLACHGLMCLGWLCLCLLFSLELFPKLPYPNQPKSPFPFSNLAPASREAASAGGKPRSG